jgi:hypothetical protein
MATGAFVRRGKVKVFKLFQKHPEFSPTFEVGKTLEMSESVFEKLMHFM